MTQMKPYGRKPLVLMLPPLAQACRKFHGFEPTDNRTRLMTDLLRGVIRKHRRASPHPFYPMRTVAHFFGVSVPTAATVFAALEREGLLRCVRASRTLVEPRTGRPRATVRGVVGLPLWQAGFVQFHDWREFYNELEPQLSQHRFVATPVFFQNPEQANPEFASRLLSHRLDVLVWFTPHRNSLHIVQTVADAGVRVILITDHPDGLPFPGYTLSWRKAMAGAFAEWKRTGITEVAVMGWNERSPNTPILRRLLDDTGFALTVPAEQGKDWPAFVASLAQRPDVGVFFADQFLANSLALHNPEATQRLLQHNRVLITRSLMLPGTLLPGAKVDAAFIDWTAVAGRIVTDLLADRVPRSATQGAIEAHWLPRVDASRFAPES